MPAHLPAKLVQNESLRDMGLDTAPELRSRGISLTQATKQSLQVVSARQAAPRFPRIVLFYSCFVFSDWRSIH